MSVGNVTPENHILTARRVPGEGPLDARVWFIGRAPEAEEVARKQQFVSNAGRYLRDVITGCEFPTARFECLIDIRPPNDDLLFFENNPIGQNYLAQSVAALKDRIKAGRPNLIVFLGVEPLKYLAGYRSVSDWRGHVFWSEELGCKCFTTYHPTAVIRQRYIKKRKVDENTYEYPGQYDALFRSDLKKAQRNCLFPELKFPEVSIITNPTLQQVRDEIKYLHETAKIISYDIETMGTNLCDCISLAATTTRTISIPFYVVGHNEVYPYWKSKEELAEVFGLVQDLLESDIPKVAQNSKYDTVFLAKNYGVEVRNLVWDTCVAAHNLYCELPKDLGTLISLYTDLPYHKHMMKEDRWTYNALDSSSTLAVMEGQLKEFEYYGTRTHYRNVTNFAIRPLVAMQLTGINVDQRLRNFAILRESAIMEDILNAFDEIFPVPVSKKTKKFKNHKFNPGSVTTKKWLFYEKFNLRKRFNKGKETTDDDAMEVWASNAKPYISTIAQAISKFQHASSMYGRMSTPLDNGRMHSNFDVTGTTTGRLASRETFWGSGTNLQNLKSGVQRQMLIPDYGEEFAVVDLWAAEAFTTGIEGKESKLLQLLKSGYKIHTWLYDQTYKKFPEECKAVGFDNAKYAYKFFKQLIHSMNYGSEPENMAKESGLPLAVCEWIYKFYHGTFVNIKVRQLNTQTQLKATRTLVSLLGRKRVFLEPYSKDLLNDAYAWPSQSCIGELTVLAGAKLYYYGVWAKNRNKLFGENNPWVFPALNSHDGLAIRTNLNDRQRVTEVIKKCFSLPIGQGEFRTTVPVEIGWAKNFNDVTDKVVV